MTSEPAEVVQDGDGSDGTEPQSAVHDPGKLLRIAVMLRETQEEVRRAPSDEQGRERLRRIHDRSIEELCDAVSGELREELEQFTWPFRGDVPSESEILIAQAQLIGWLEGLFQGIQAAIANQQMQARQQLQQMRGRALPGGQAGQGQPLLPGQGDAPAPGQYL